MHARNRDLYFSLGTLNLELTKVYMGITIAVRHAKYPSETIIFSWGSPKITLSVVFQVVCLEIQKPENRTIEEIMNTIQKIA